MTSEEEREQADFFDDLLAPIPRKAIIPAVRAALGVSQHQSDRIVQAFDDFVARPLVANLTEMKPLAGRGVTSHAEKLAGACKTPLVPVLLLCQRGTRFQCVEDDACELAFEAA